MFDLYGWICLGSFALCVLIVLAAVTLVKANKRKPRQLLASSVQRSDGRDMNIVIEEGAIIVRMAYQCNRLVSLPREANSLIAIFDDVYEKGCAAGFIAELIAIRNNHKDVREILAKRVKESIELEKLNADQEVIIDALRQKTDARKRSIEKLVAKMKADRLESRTMGKDLVALQNLIAGLAERCHGQSEALAARAVRTTPIGPLDFTLPPGKWTPDMVKAFNGMPAPKQK